jgi:hypothetical protein
MIILLIAIVVAGVLMYALAANPKISEIGRIMFFVSLLVLLFRLGPDLGNVFSGIGAH